jgi:protein gp37
MPRPSERFRGIPGHPYEQGFDLRLVPEKLSEPFLWSSPRIVFVNSMSDLFQPGVPDAYIEDVVRVMVEANWHTYQVLTKRSERLRDLLSTKLRFATNHRHIWWGSVSRTGGTVCHELSIFAPPLQRSNFYPSSPFWKISRELFRTDSRRGFP